MTPLTEADDEPMDVLTPNTRLSSPDAMRLAYTAVSTEDYSRFSEAWDKSSGNMARTAQMLEKPLHVVAQHAYIYGAAPKDDPRVMPFIFGVPECFGEDSPAGSVLASRNATLRRAPEDVAGEAFAFLRVHDGFVSPRQDRENRLLREHVLPVLERRRVDLVLQGHDHVYGRRGGEDARRDTPQYLVSVVGAKQYRLGAQARQDMAPTAEDTQLFQVIRIDGDTLRYESRTATGRLYDAFELRGATPAARTLHEITDGRITPRDCARAATLKGRADRCWE